MSSLIVEVVRIDDIKEHPNADRLEIVVVKGWECIVQKGFYKIGDRVVYTPIDSVVPSGLSDKLDVTKYLSSGRVRTAKLRGIYSQGLIIPMTHVPNSDNLQIGDDVAETLGIAKFEPPIKVQMDGLHRVNEPRFIKYTDIENIKNFPNVLREGEEVAITEKLHGTNFRAANIDGEIHVGGHRINFKESDDNLYWKASRIYNLEEILGTGEQIFGEIYGFKIQKLAYGLKNKFDVRSFDLIVNNKYVDYPQFKNYCEVNKLPMVPELYVGKWHKDLMKLADGKTMLANHVREGIVIRPIEERFDGELGRVILKHVNEEYLMKDYGDLH